MPLQFTLRPDAPPSEEMLAFLRLLQLGGSDAFLLESLFRNEVWAHMQAPVSADNERAVCSSMVAGAQVRTAGWGGVLSLSVCRIRVCSIRVYCSRVCCICCMNGMPAGLPIQAVCSSTVNGAQARHHGVWWHPCLLYPLCGGCNHSTSGSVVSVVWRLNQMGSTRLDVTYIRPVCRRPCPATPPALTTTSRCCAAGRCSGGAARRWRSR